jgi:hypothetical protein
MESRQAGIARHVDALVVRHVGLAVDLPQMDVRFSAGVKKA